MINIEYNSDYPNFNNLFIASSIDLPHAETRVFFLSNTVNN